MSRFYGKFAAVVLSSSLCVTTFADTISVNPAVAKQQEKQFIQQMVTQDHFSRWKLTRLFNGLKEDPKIIQSMTAPFEKQPWSFYRNFFLTQERITLGAEYMKTHYRVLHEMSRKYGIPASIITAIIGVETEYGTHLGKYSVLRSLYTLGFYYPPREKFFRKELGQYLILTRENGLNPTSIKGSYAGALGIPQFMPSSYRYYGVALEKNAPVNLFNNNDAIASVANYFHKMGWAANQPIAYRLRSAHQSLNEGASRLTLPLPKGAEYWETFKNFKVIMTYNHNVVYAMAVYQLSRQIEKQYAENNRQAQG